MRKFYSRIIFSKTPLKKFYNFENKFQIFPLISDNAPKSQDAKHFPLVLEYYIDYDKNNKPRELEVLHNLSENQSMEKEIMNLLTVFTNHRFFSYSMKDQWSIKIPTEEMDKLSKEEIKHLNNQSSFWSWSFYTYPEMISELYIQKFSKPNIPEIEIVSPYYSYFTNNPIETRESEIKFPETLYSCLKAYYSLSSKTKRKVKSLIYLICDGIDISDRKRSISFITFVSAIEGLVSLEYSDKEIEFECENCKAIKSSPHNCPSCGRPIWGIKTKFKEFLKKFVAGGRESMKKYNKIYNLRCKIAHQGILLLGDYDFSLGKVAEKERDWLIKLETLQLAKLSLTNWIRYPQKASH